MPFVPVAPTRPRSLISTPMDFRRASAEALAAARAGADARPWACLALAALQGGSRLRSPWGSGGGLASRPLADRPARQEALEALALAHLDAGTPHRIFRRAFSLITATPGLWRALLPNLFVAAWVQGCFAEGAGPAFGQGPRAPCWTPLTRSPPQCCPACGV